jgi:hypothetical protein
MDIIGFCGPKGHGKDTAASAMRDQFRMEQVNFADGVKDVVAQVLDIRLDWLHMANMKESVHAPSGKTYRQWMQHVGTEGFRAMWPDVWANYYQRNVTKHPRVITTDVRFPNEVAAIQSLTNNYKIYCIFDPRKHWGDTHESERYWDTLWDHKIINDGSIENLRSRVYDQIIIDFPWYKRGF